MTAESAELAKAPATELTDLVSCALADGGYVVAAALEKAGYEVGEVQPVHLPDGSVDEVHVKIPAVLHDGPGEVTLTVELG